jgi:ribosomal protein S18 acetylase RimI-like enzyme
MTTDPRFTTRELSPQTWPDFERLFSQGGGWDFCACMVYQRGHHLKGPSRAAQAHVLNLRAKRQLVEHGRSHGILVYATDEAVGWCQYGPTTELPFPDADQVQKGVPVEDPTSQWRITCFVTHKKHRRHGVASIALAAALESIRKQGGGWIEATPLASTYTLPRRYRQLVKAYGKDSPEAQKFLEDWPSVVVRGVGRVPAEQGGFGSRAWVGTVSMFERQGFDAVKIVRSTRVLMRRYL